MDKKKFFDTDSVILVIKKTPPTHVILNLEVLKDYGWEKASILGVVDHYGNCDQKNISEALSFLSIERISFLLNEMQKDGLVGGVNV